MFVSVNNCGDPGTPKNGYRKSNETTVGSKIEFACDTGYKLVGLDAIVCQQYGNWTGPIPECQCKCLTYASFSPINAKRPIRAPSEFPPSF